MSIMKAWLKSFTMLQLVILIQRIQRHSMTLVFFFVALITQLVQILKPFPSSSISHCNFKVELTSFASLRLDCDAGYFLLDSQYPTRFLSGDSPFLDRPVPALLVYLFSSVLQKFGLPSFPITYVGEDLIPQTYWALNYSLFLLLNVIFLLTAVYFYLKTVRQIDPKNTLSLALIFPGILFLSQNRVSAEFFWTPHTIMLNITIPAMLIYLLFLENPKNEFKRLYVLGFCLLFVYPISIIFLCFLIFKVKIRLIPKVILLGIPVFLYLLLPDFVRILGGNNTNTLISEYRRFSWLIPGSVDSSQEFESKGALYFVMSLFTSPPKTLVISTTLLILTYVLVYSRNRDQVGNSIYFTDHFWFLAIFLAYGLFLLGTGTVLPRQTTGLILYSSVYFLCLIQRHSNRVTNLEQNCLATLLIFLSGISWFSPRGEYL